MKLCPNYQFEEHLENHQNPHSLSTDINEQESYLQKIDVSHKK